MKKVFKMFGVCLTGALFAIVAVAGETSNSFPTGLQFGVGLSATSGLNGFVGYANKNYDSFWWKRLGFRFDFASTRPIRSKIDSVIDHYMEDEYIEVGDDVRVMQPKIKAKHIAAMIDIYPFGNTWFLGGWRLTGGYYKGDMHINAVMESTDAFEFDMGGKKFRYTDGAMHGKAKVDWKYSGPYAGTGFDLGLFYGLKIFVDAGVVFTSKAAELDLDIPTDNLEIWDSGWTPATAEDVNEAKHDELRDKQKKLNDIKYYPMVKVGFMYRF